MIPDGFKPALAPDWAPFDGYYVSSDGVVATAKRGRWKIMRQHRAKNGYMVVPFYSRGRAWAPTVHSLVARAFVPCPDVKMQINHIDAVKSNNRAVNLEWVSAKQNTAHSHMLGLAPHAENTYNHKLTVEAVRNIRQRYSEGGCTQRGLASEYGVSQRAILFVLKRTRWRSV